eukprot:CAMPEP_0185731346 /NCGR_PEP_ID=MMETSP1171-20130828/12651_1 /TAXON_ID=374046 /ORGANISM="Helicotheca tamensis, Strain CCMP826" /LENGTH=228 /DNA_ID=CAMNT_0028400597 /DNA_START=76 /DNA_END=762 /DNA_ORIENTATION=+
MLITSYGEMNAIRPALSRNFGVVSSSSANSTASNNVVVAGNINSHKKRYYRFFQQTASSMIFGVTGTTTAAAITLCDDGNKGNDEEDILTKIKNMVSDPDGKANEIATAIGSKIQDAVDTGMPTQLSYGFVCGFCSGYAMRKVGQIGAVIFGMGFCTLQTLSYYGYVQVDHDRIKKDFEGLLDLNDDGKIDKEDVNILSDKVMEVISYNVPGGSGFAAGFVGGLRSGR